MNDTLKSLLTRIQVIALIVGLVALALTVCGAFVERSQFFFSYLFGYLFWLGLSLGCFLVAMIHTLTGGRWGFPTRRFLEAGYLVLPLMLVLFIPICFGLHELYPWARPEEVAAEKASVRESVGLYYACLHFSRDLDLDQPTTAAMLARAGYSGRCRAHAQSTDAQRAGDCALRPAGHLCLR